MRRMGGVLPICPMERSTAVKQICICAWDLDKAERAWNGILGIEGERIKTPPWTDAPSHTNGTPDAFDGVEFPVYHLAGGIALEIFGPGDGENPWRDFLKKHGEGAMNLAFFVPDREAAYGTIAETRRPKGPYHEGFCPGGTCAFADTFQELGAIERP